MRSEPSTRIERLHRDESGLASMEFVLALPVLLLMVLAIQHAHLLMRLRQDLVVAVRTAAFAEARSGSCWSQATPPPATGAVVRFNRPGCTVSRFEPATGEGGFWSGANNAAGWREGTLARAPQGGSLSWVRASGTLSYTVANLQPSWSTVMLESFFVPTARFWTFHESHFARGYAEPLRGAMGRSNGLFPRLFGI